MEPQEIAWRNIRITELDTPAPKRETELKKESSASHAPPSADAVTDRETISLFDGKTLNGWVTLDDRLASLGDRVTKPTLSRFMPVGAGSLNLTLLDY